MLGLTVLLNRGWGGEVNVLPVVMMQVHPPGVTLPPLASVPLVRPRVGAGRSAESSIKI